MARSFSGKAELTMMKSPNLLQITRQAKGFSLVELMVAIAIGLFLVAGLTVVFANSSRTYGELQKAAQQIENGRLAISILSEDIKNAGQFGDFIMQPPISGAPIAIPGTSPDPCISTSNLAALKSSLKLALPLHVQGYGDVTSLPSGLTNCLTSSTVAKVTSNTDILVVRRGDTLVLVDPEASQNGGSATTSATPVAGEVYIQSALTDVAVQVGVAQLIDKTKTAENTAASLTRKDFTITPAGTTGGYVRKLHIHVYFVSDCADADCSSSTRNIPTLKRAELVAGSGGVPLWRIVPLVEGIESLQIEYGIDTAPATLNAATGYFGDGTADSFVDAPTATTWDATGWSNVVAVRLFVLARNTEQTTGYSDSKAYELRRSVAASTGANSIAAKNDSYKRHVFEMEVPVINTINRRLPPS